MIYTNNGFLEKGLYSMPAQAFIDSFCKIGNRKQYEKAIVNIFDYAKSHGGTRLIIGGSFISKTENPRDLDCLIVFHHEKDIPTFLDCAQIDNIEYDILYTSEDMSKTIDTYIKLMSYDKYGIEEHGVVEVLLYDKIRPWEVVYEPNDDELEIISRVYCNRNIIERNKRRGLLIVIHGLLTRAEWLSNLIPAANSQGWIVAPFIYDNPPTLLTNKNKRQDVINQFRDWVYGIVTKYGQLNVSVLCHSFGTYIITKYIDGFSSLDEPFPARIDSIILSGSIVNPDYNWNIHIPKKIGRVLNIVAENDDAVKYMPDADWKKMIGMDTLFGQGAIKGIKNVSLNVENIKMNVLTHTNIFKNDVIEKVFLPYLNVNNGISSLESTQLLFKELQSK